MIFKGRVLPVVQLLQIELAWEDKRSTFYHLEQFLARHPPLPGSLVVLPEMFATGFSMNLANTLAGEPMETAGFVGTLARHYRCYITAGFVQLGPQGTQRNEAVTFDPDGRALARYAKQRLFPGVAEEKHHVPGNVSAPWGWAGFNAATFICYDLRFPELFRTAVSQGAELLIVIANWPIARASHWRALLLARAIENQAYVLGVNRTGTDPHFNYSGGSLIIGPRGEFLAEAEAGEAVLSAKLDLEELRRWRHTFPALRGLLPI